MIKLTLEIPQWAFIVFVAVLALSIAVQLYVIVNDKNKNDVIKF